MSPLQHADSTESRKHVLSECPKTIHLLTSYATNLKYISPQKYSEYRTVPLTLIKDGSGY